MNSFSSSFYYGLNKIDYEVLYTARKTMEIGVHPNCRVIVRAPIGTPPADIEAKLFRRARWIRRKLNYFYQFEPRTPARHYISGETFLYLGRQYRLKVQSGESNTAKLDHGYFWVSCKTEKSPMQVKKLMDKWYLRKAKEKFTESFDRCIPKFKAIEFELPSIQVRKMNTRWGSMSQLGILTLNANLVRAPKECIDYVITHEICHRIYRKHGHEFYQLLERQMPDWRTKKQRLEIIST